MQNKQYVYEENRGGGGTGSGTMSVTLDIALNGGDDRYAIHNAAKEKVQQELGFNLPGPFDQVKHGRLPTESVSCFLFSNSITLCAPGDVRLGEVLHRLRMGGLCLHQQLDERIPGEDPSHLLDTHRR